MARVLVVGVVIVLVAFAVLTFLSPPRPVVVPSASPTASASATVPTASPTRPPSPAATTSAPATSPPASPGSTPATACPTQTGGTEGRQVQLTALRVAHNPGFDRVVFEFGQSTAPGQLGMPPYQVAVASSLSGASGQPVTIAGNALFGVRVQNASTVQPDGMRTYTGPTSVKPTTPLVREVRLVEDFERVMVWGIGLERLACPQVLVLGSPVRLVLDFPTPP